jgi:hypothetical protein
MDNELAFLKQKQPLCAFAEDSITVENFMRKEEWMAFMQSTQSRASGRMRFGEEVSEEPYVSQ